MTSARDWHVLDDIRARLLATTEFDAVYAAAVPETRGQAAGARFAAVVAPLDWSETDRDDDPHEPRVTRRVRWTLVLIVREEDPELRAGALDRLQAVAHRTLDRRSLGGVTVPAWTWLSGGKYEPATPPEQRMTCVGEWTQWIDAADDRDVR